MRPFDQVKHEIKLALFFDIVNLRVVFNTYGIFSRAERMVILFDKVTSTEETQNK